MRDEWYDKMTKEFTELVRTVNPKRGAAESAHIAVLLISIVDGMTLHLGTARNKRAYMRGFESIFHRSFLNVILGGFDGESARLLAASG